MGLKLNKLAAFTERFDKAGFKYDPPRIGRESTPQPTSPALTDSAWSSSKTHGSRRLW